jgi:hypothetical protein
MCVGAQLPGHARAALPLLEPRSAGYQVHGYAWQVLQNFIFLFDFIFVFISVTSCGDFAKEEGWGGALGGAKERGMCVGGA